MRRSSLTPPSTAYECCTPSSLERKLRERGNDVGRNRTRGRHPRTRCRLDVNVRTPKPGPIEPRPATAEATKSTPVGNCMMKSTMRVSPTAHRWSAESDDRTYELEVLRVHSSGSSISKTNAPATRQMMAVGKLRRNCSSGERPPSKNGFGAGIRTRPSCESGFVCCTLA